MQPRREAGHSTPSVRTVCVIFNTRLGGSRKCTKKYSVSTVIRGPFEKFVDSPYCSDSELCGGAVTVSFSNYLPWQVMHFLQRSAHVSKTCCRPLITSKFLASELPFHGGKSPEIAWGEIWIEFSVFGLEKADQWNPIRTSAIQCRSLPMRFLGFSNHEKGAPRQEISKWSTVCSTFSRRGWSVVRSASLAKRGTSKKRQPLHLHKVPTQSNKVSPRTLQTALVHTVSCLQPPVFFFVMFRKEMTRPITFHPTTSSQCAISWSVVLMRSVVPTYL
jgi:hypothetical protein